MDDKLKFHLKENGLESYISILEDQGILTSKIFGMLEENDYGPLVKNLADKIKMRTLVSFLKLDEEASSNNITLDSVKLFEEDINVINELSNVNSSWIPLSDVSCLDIESQSISETASMTENTSLESPVVYISQDQTLVDANDTCSGSCNQALDDLVDQAPTVAKYEASSSNSFQMNDSGSAKKRPRREETSSCDNTLSNLQINKESIHEILNSTVKGKALLESYDKNDTVDLSPMMQDTIVQIIMDNLVYSKNTSIKYNEFDELANIISEIFPGICKESLFSGKMNNKKKIPVGKLYYRYVNNKTFLRHLDAKKKGDSSQTKEAVSRVFEPNISDLEKKLWLKHNNSPWNEVLSKWEKTADMRKSSNMSANLESLINEWPLLKQEQGYTLIERDFEIHFPTITSLHVRCDELLDKLSAFYVKEGQSNSFKDDDERAYILMNKLPQSCGQPIKRHKNKFWRVSVQESTSAFLNKIQAASDIDPANKKRVEKLQEFGLTLQPSLFIVEDHHFNRMYYVVFGSVKYKFRALVKAVLVCLKIFQVYNLEYPFEARSVWTFLQRFLLKLKLKSDQLTPGMVFLEKELGKISS